MASNGATPGGFDPTEIAGLSFETAYTRLEESVTRLQMGNLSLDDALNAYEEGMALSTHCQHLLERAELRVQVLDRAPDDDDDGDSDGDDVILDDDDGDPPF